jgi:DNA adenine methylase
MIEPRMQKELFTFSSTKPIIKWAGGKQQILSEILRRAPKDFNNYIEPFVGGGAVFFAIAVKNSIISDTNPELINLYKILPWYLYEIIEELKKYRNDEKFYYRIRAKKVKHLNKVERAARFIYLNRTCFNGLYRVNKKGEFNVPFGKYKNPKIIYPERLKKAARCLEQSIVLHSDYKQVLDKYAKKNDFIFLDPPYIPISEYSDFKRYTKDQFYKQDHKKLAEKVRELAKIGCKIILTNSNHPLVHEYYKDFKIEVLQTKRNINKNGAKRTGEDTIITINI